MKKTIALLMALVMVLCLLPSMTLAASWEPDDEITITVDVFDYATNTIYQKVGTDTVTKGDEKIQSNNYRIPELSKFTSQKYGRVLEVTGNWYGVYSSCNVGTNVTFSCNSDTARITYWVSYYGTASGSTTGGNETIDYGSGNKQWSQTIVYHANYPDGTDAEYTVVYNIQSYANIANYNLKTYDGCGFTVPAGYTLRDRVWDTKKDGTGENYANGGNYPFKQENHNQTIHLYAQYNEPQPDPDSRYTITYYDGTEKVGEDTVVAGKSTTTMSALIKDGCTFLGWSTTPDGNVEYAANVTITPTSNMTLYAVWEENYTPNPSAPPAKPDDYDTLKNLLDKIKVTCVTDTAHGTEEFDLIDGSYTVGAVGGNATSGYTCEVSISPDKYVAAYNAEVPGHTTDDTAKTVTLKYNSGAWALNDPSELPVEFNVKCETPQPTAPIAPGANTLGNLLNGNIKVTCVTNGTTHGPKYFNLLAGSYTVGDVEGSANSGYTCDVSISPAKYVAAYNAEVPGHTTDDTAKIVTLKYNNDSDWVVNTGTPVEFNVKCETEQPTPPAKPTDNDVLGIEDEAVKVHCINDSSGSDDHSYNILPGSFSIGDVILKDGVYTCDITVRPELYVAEYVKDFGKPHTLSPAVQTGTITLIYYAENQVWDLMPNDDLPIVFTVTCSDEDETFTVTYLDGFSGTYATYTNLKYGDATPVPANPYRSGYIFLGWEPSVAPTVTGDARYVAQWGYIGPQYPNPTPVQPVQPGILPPQTGDMPLWYAIARFLGLVK